MMRDRAAEEKIREGAKFVGRGLSGSFLFMVMTVVLFWLAHSTGQTGNSLDLPITVTAMGAIGGLLMFLHGIGKILGGYWRIRRNRIEDDGDLTSGSWNA